jgi:hypothetical protein
VSCEDCKLFSPNRHKRAQKSTKWDKPAQSGTKKTKAAQKKPLWPNLAQNVILFQTKSLTANNRHQRPTTATNGQQPTNGTKSQQIGTDATSSHTATNEQPPSNLLSTCSACLFFQKKSTNF